MRSLEDALRRAGRVHLASLPTPMQRLGRLEERWKHPGLYIKRDDLTGLGPGGNKLRSLEFLLAEAAAQGAKTVVAAGPLQSNFCTLTAAACAKLGLSCILVHNAAQPGRMEGNVLLNHLLGAKARYLGPVSAEAREAYVKELEQAAPQGEKIYVARNGATTGRGALGYVAAIGEIQHQAEALGLREMTIFAPGGNGGVASGLIYGNALSGFPFRIVIISVENDCAQMRAAISRTISEAEEILELPFPGRLEDACVLDDSFRGEGWGVHTEQSTQMVLDFARAEGILIENVYNSKVLVGMQSYLASGRVDGPACYLHTGGLGSLFAQY